jgi:hypothetical protein
MSNARDFFLNEESVTNALDFPDEAIDYAFMLSENDWHELRKEFKHRSDLWKESITYFAGFVLSVATITLLIEASNENNPIVKKQALVSIYQFLNYNQNVNKFIVEHLVNNKTDLINTLQQSSDAFEEYPEFPALISILESY